MHEDRKNHYPEGAFSPKAYPLVDWFAKASSRYPLSGLGANPGMNYLHTTLEDKKYTPQLRALKSYQRVFKNYYTNLMKGYKSDGIEVSPEKSKELAFHSFGWNAMEKVLMAQKEAPPTFFISDKFFTRLEAAITHALNNIRNETHELLVKQFHEFRINNSICPYPVALYYLPDSGTPILGIRTEHNSYYAWQAFMPKDTGGVLFLYDSNDYYVSTLTQNEPGIADMDIWTTPINDSKAGKQQGLVTVYHELLQIISVSSIAIQSPEAHCLPVNSQNKVTKIKDAQDEHKLYRVNLSNSQGGNRKPSMFYVPRKQHDVKGHTRTYKKSGKTIYIKNHKRGNASLGVITKDYLLDD